MDTAQENIDKLGSSEQSSLQTVSFHYNKVIILVVYLKMLDITLLWTWINIIQ